MRQSNSILAPCYHKAQSEPQTRSFIRRVLMPFFALIALALIPFCQPIAFVIAMTNGVGQTMAQEGA